MTDQQAQRLSITVPLAWGTSYVLMKLAVADGSPLMIVALRCGLAFLVTGALFFRRILRADARALAYSAVTGGLLFGVFLCVLYGVEDISASEAGFLQSTTVVIVPILQSVCTRTLPRGKTVAGVLVVTAGLYLLSGGPLTGVSAGALCCLLSALLYALHILLSKRFVSRIDPLCLGVCQLGFAAVYALAAAAVLGETALPGTALEWGAVLGLALICSAYGFVMQAILQRHVSPETTGFLFSLEPVFSAIFAFFFLHEHLRMGGYAGAALIFFGVFLATRSEGPAPAPERPLPAERN